MIGAAIGIGAGMAAAGTGIAGGALSVKGTKPKGQFYGGSQDALNQYRQAYGQGATQSQQLAQQGIGQIYGQGGAQQQALAYGQAGAAQQAQAGQGFYDQSKIVNDRAAALGYNFNSAYQQNQHASQLAYQQQLSQAQNANLAMARSGAGGALAMRNALAANSNMAGNAMQAAQIARAQENTAALQQYSQLQAAGMNAQAGLAGQYVNQGNIGAQMQAQGLGFQGQYAGLAGQIGTNLSGQYMDANNSMNTAQLDADWQAAKARAEAQQNKRNFIGQIGTSLIGGGATMMSSAFKRN